MREWREISAGSDRSLRRHAGREARVDESLEKTYQLRAHPGEALQQARELQHQCEAHDRIVEQRADAGAVRQDDVPLQQSALRGRDARVGEQAEAGVDAVGGRIGRGEPRGDGMGIAHGAERRRVDLYADRAPVHAPQVGEAQRSGAKLQRVGFGHRRTSPARTTVRRGLKPIQYPSSSMERRFHTTKSAAWPGASAPRSPWTPSARAAWRVTPSSASSAVRPNSRVAMLIASSSEAPGAEPGLQSLAMASATWCARSAATGGLRSAPRQ